MAWKNARYQDEMTRRQMTIPVMERKLARLECVICRMDPFGVGTIPSAFVGSALREAGMVLSDMHVKKAFDAHNVCPGKFQYRGFIDNLQREISNPGLGGSAWEKPRTPMKTSYMSFSSIGKPSVSGFAPLPRVISGPGLSMRLPPIKGGNRGMTTSFSAPVLPGQRSDAADELAQAINERFDSGRMFQAFKAVDLDNSGRLHIPELKKVLDMCTIPSTPEMLEALFKELDTDGDGVSYKEFVRMLAQDTVQTGKASWERADVRATRPEDIDPSKGIFGKIESNRAGGKAAIVNAKQGIVGKTGNLAGAASDAISRKFTKFREAFDWIDVSNDGFISIKEIERLLEMCNIPMDPDEIAGLHKQCDADGSGNVTYDELVKVLARDKFVGAK